MSEEKFYNQEHPNLPEHSALPEHTTLPEYNPVYPDVTYFKESFVTTREENIFQGEPPAGEKRRVSREEKRKERERYTLLQRLLGLAFRGGAAVLCAMLVVSVVSFAENKGDNAWSIRKAVQSAQRPAFTVQTSYDADTLARLWARDPDAPHKYDLVNPLLYREPTCTEEGEVELVCLECGVHAHNVLEAAGHKAGDPVKENVTEATCQSEGGYTEIVNCTVCGTELSRRDVVVAKTDHTPGEPVIENEAEATCTEDGHRDETITCTVCGEVIFSGTVTEPAKGHTAADAVRENETEATCTEEGGYDEVVYCSVCREEMSRTSVRTAALGHKAAAAVRENETDAICEKGGSYDEVVYCSVCHKELSRNTVVQAAAGHTPSAAVKENEVAAACEKEGSYDNVVYCSVCKKEISRETVKTAATGHSASSAVKENETAATCTAEGHYDNVVRCTVCQKELSRTTVTSAALGHSAASAVKENEVSETCTSNGHYDNVVYCSRCHTELSRSTVTVAALGHSAAAAVKENEVAATCTEGGHYDNVVKCSRCSQELSRTAVQVAPLGHDYQQQRENESGNACVGYQYYYMSKCTRCGQIEPNTGASQPEWEDGIGHDYPTNPSGQVVTCPRCGNDVQYAYLDDYNVYYGLYNEYPTFLSENGISITETRLVNVTTGATVRTLDGSSGQTSVTTTIVPASGTQFKILWVLSNGGSFSSYTMTVP